MKTILVADDQDIVRELVQVIFGDAGFRVLEAASGAQALALAREHAPDLILLDVTLPVGPDGLTVCRELKGNPHTQGSIVVLLSARGLREEVEAGYSAGADDYVVKPFSPAVLIDRIRRLLGEEV